ncbi:MAG: hypothetical protein QOK42_1025 [Frankiaceae bacterium]|nr:hypothetical protein [Frankiaceae bacterium]
MRLALAATLLLVAVSGCTSSDSARTPAAPRNGFHIEYDVTDDRGLHTVEVTDVDRPYRARTVRSAEGHSVGGVAWTESGVYQVRPDGSTQQVSPSWPAAPGPDSHLDVALPVALRQHLVRQASGSEVLGRRCTGWLSKQPLDGAPFTAPTPGERTTSCVSAEGVILSDSWTRDGKVLRARVATALGPPAALTDRRLFAPSPTPAPANLSGFSVTPSTESELTRLIPTADPAPPPGMHSDKAVAVLDIDRSGEAPAVTREGAVLTWVGAGHLVEAKYGRDLRQPTPAPTGGAPIKLGLLGTGRLTPVLAGLRVDVLGPKGLLLTVISDLPEAQLLAWMRSLSF